jgi:3-hydroxyacyl-CoA dehydrogenase/enoyl-CoA hydratase/3-hydroxybutyryl-CoA epimerase
MQTLSYHLADNGVAFITIDVKDRPVNVLTPELHREIGEVAALLAADDKARGAVIHSGKSSFMAGGDLNRIVRYYDMHRSAAEAYAQSRAFTESLRKLETCGKPVAVAINGTALGGGLELALACHFRVVADDEKILLGLPEVSLGLLPGGGGTQRLPRLIGLKQAADLILGSKRLGPAEALQMGIVHKVVPAADLVAVAEQWVLQGGNPQQPWDRKGFQVPGGSSLNDMNIGRLFQQLTGRVSADYRHNYPAPIATLRCLFNGTTVLSMDEALRIETREFSALTRDPVARNLIRTLFINKGKTTREQLMADPAAQALQRRCAHAYIQQGRALLAEGVKPALIENAAFAVGLPQGPLAMAHERSAGEAAQSAPAGLEVPAVAEANLVKTTLEKTTSAKPTVAEPGFNEIRQRLLCAQALAAAVCWEEGLTDPVQADLASILGWSFPSYTGGVLSHIDTLGLNAFISLCDSLSTNTMADLKPSVWLRTRAQNDDRIYPSTA